MAVEDLVQVFKATLLGGELSRQTVAVLGPERLSTHAAVQRIADTHGKRPRYVRLPVAVQLCLAWGFERVMKVPLVSIAQVRILAEGAFQPLPGCGRLPERLTPKTHLHREQIRKGLPPARRFGLRDLRFCT